MARPTNSYIGVAIVYSIMAVNETQLIVLRWLISTLNVEVSEILYNNKTYPPISILSDGTRYTGKYLYVNQLIFTKKQSELLKEDDVIVVVDKNKVVDSFKWSLKDTVNYKIHVPLPKHELKMFLKKKENKIGFKQILEEFTDSDECIKSIVSAYKLYPQIFKVKFS